MTEKTTAPLADFGAGDIASAGGKGAALGELVRQGFPVPRGLHHHHRRVPVLPGGDKGGCGAGGPAAS